MKLKIEDVLLFGVVTVIVYQVFMKKDPSEVSEEESEYRGRVLSMKIKTANGQDRERSTPPCSGNGQNTEACGGHCVMPGSCQIEKGDDAGYTAIPSPGLNLVDEPLGLAQITFGPNESDYAAKSLLSPIATRRKKKKKKKVKSKPMF